MKYLWFREVAKAKRIMVQNIQGIVNLDDVLTSPCSAVDVSPLPNIVDGSLVRRSGAVV